MTNQERNAYWDNLKLILIFWVVLGHFLLPVYTQGKLLQMAYYWIYTFHMPAFAFVSGVFSKSYVNKEHKEYKLISFLNLFIFFTVALWIVLFLFKHTTNFRSIISVSGAPWYLLSMFFWYLGIPFMGKVKPVFSIVICILFALAAGVFRDCGDFLALSRTIVLFPFFLTGFHFKNSSINRIRNWMRAPAVVVLTVGFAVLFLFAEKVSVWFPIVYANSSYETLGFSNLQGIMIRSAWYAAATVMTIALMLLVPSKRFRFTFIGERTLTIYIFHRLVRDVCMYMNIYQYLGRGILLMFACIMISAGTVICIGFSKKLSLWINKISQFDNVMMKQIKES